MNAAIDLHLNYEQQLLAIREKGLKQRGEATERAAQQEIEIEKLTNEQKLSIASQTFKNLATIAGEQSAAGKALAIAGTLIDTYQSAQAAYKAMAGIPVVGPALGAIAAAAAVASGLKAVQQIKSTQLPNIPGASGGGGGGGRGAAVPAQPSFNIVGQSGQNQIAEAIGEQNRNPVKAYVVGKDVSTQQELDRNIVEGAGV